MTAAKKRPPTFRFLPETRAKQLKKSWVQDHKLRRKWMAQRRKEGLTNQTVDDRHQDGVRAGAEPSDRLDGLPSPSPAPSHGKQSLRDLRKFAYTSSSPCEAHALPRGSKATVGRKVGQPNMRLRMNLLLEKIKRDLP